MTTLSAYLLGVLTPFIAIFVAAVFAAAAEAMRRKP